MFKKVKYSLELSHDLHACVNVLMHKDIFSGIYTRIGTGDILVRILGSWGNLCMISVGRDECSSK